jgi:DNA gyrase subunit B
MIDYSKMDMIDAVRRRPGMYVGGTDAKALHHIIEALLDNTLVYVLSGQCTVVQVTLHQDGMVTVEDNGPGMLVSHEEKLDMSCLQIALTNHDIGSQLTGTQKYRSFGGIHGIGLAVINALCERLVATIRRKGRLYRQSYERGQPTSSVETVRDLEEGEGTGTLIALKPDPEIFTNVAFELEPIKHRLGELAYAFPDATFSVHDERSEPPHHQLFHSQDGVIDYLRFLNRDCRKVYEMIHDHREMSCRSAGTGDPYTFEVDFALQVTDRDDVRLWIMVNGVPVESTVVQAGLRWAVIRMLTQQHDYDTKKWLINNWQQTYDKYPCGLTAVFSIRHPNPLSESSVGASFGNAEVEFAIATVVFDALKAHARHREGMMFKYFWSPRKFCCANGEWSVLDEIEEDEDDLEQDA